MINECGGDTNTQTWGLELRSLLTWYLHQRGPLTVSELEGRLECDAIAVSGRASKTISDALRWEVARGRVVRLQRGVYGPGSIPRSTEHRIRRRAQRVIEDPSRAA